MDRRYRLGIWFVLAFLLGVTVTVVLTTQWDVTPKVQASSDSAITGKGATPSQITPQEQDLINQLNGVFIKAAERVMPSVVTIFSEKVIKMRYRSPFDFFFGDEFFREFFGTPSPRRRRPRDEEQKFVQKGMGSGVIVRSDGIILTNYHVIKDADDIRVKTTDGKVYEAEIVGTDPQTDLAVVRIDAENLPVAPLGDSDKIRVGEWVLAIGNPFSEQLHHTVTKGIVSAKGRSDLRLAEYEDFIQTDAPINPGNSGGALVNLRGEVIGINTAIVAPSGAFAGIGFAIPINMAKKVMNDLLTKGKVVRGYLGVYIQPVDEDLARALGLKEAKGALVVEVEEGSPADRAGIKTSDVIVKFNGVEVRNPDHLKMIVADTRPGVEVPVVVNRGGKQKTLHVVLGEREGETVASAPSMKEEVSKKLGFEVSDLTAELAQQYGYENVKGVIITRIDPTSEAARKGLREGDVIKEVNRKRVTSVAEFTKIIRSAKPGDVVLFLAQRGKNNFFVALEIPKE
jgi:serine protease Do